MAQAYPDVTDDLARDIQTCKIRVRMYKERLAADGNATSFSGKAEVSVYAMVVIASALKLYARHGIRVNRAYTPTAMMRAGRAYLGEPATKGIKSRDYLGMSDALYASAHAEKARIAALEYTQDIADMNATEARYR